MEVEKAADDKKTSWWKLKRPVIDCRYCCRLAVIEVTQPYAL